MIHGIQKEKSNKKIQLLNKMCEEIVVGLHGAIFSYLNYARDFGTCEIDAHNI